MHGASLNSSRQTLSPDCDAMGLCGVDSAQNGHRSPERQNSEFPMGKANANHIPIRSQDCEATNPFGEGGQTWCGYLRSGQAWLLMGPRHQCWHGTQHQVSDSWCFDCLAVSGCICYTGGMLEMDRIVLIGTLVFRTKHQGVLDQASIV
jgi:hypothetical protein